MAPKALKSDDKEGNADNAVALKWHFQGLRKEEKGKAWDGLGNCLAAGSSRWKEARSEHLCREAKYSTGSAKTSLCRLLIASCLAHEYLFAVFPDMQEKSYLENPIPGLTQE